MSANTQGLGNCLAEFHTCFIIFFEYLLIPCLTFIALSIIKHGHQFIKIVVFFRAMSDKKINITFYTIILLYIKTEASVMKCHVDFFLL